MVAKTYRQLPSNLIAHTELTEFTDKEKVVESIRKGIIQIVKAPSIAQSLNGIMTAGVPRSVRYVRDKLKKSKR